MLGFLFGFNARLGRLNYFLATIGLAIVMAAICFVIAGSYIQYTPGVKISSAALMNGWSTLACHLVLHLDDLHAAVDADQGYRVGSRLRHSGVDRDPHRR